MEIYEFFIYMAVGTLILAVLERKNKRTFLSGICIVFVALTLMGLAGFF